MGATQPSGAKEARTLRQEHAALQVQNQLLRAEVIALRQQAHYHRSQHRRAVARAEELEAQVGVLKAKVAELQQRLFGRKSERTRRATLLAGNGQSGVAARARGQQPGRAGHGRKRRETLPVVEAVLDLCDSETRCPYCGLGWDPFGPPHRSEQIEWEVRLFRRRTLRPKYRRPSGCQCQPQRPDIISAPLPPALIAKGLLANSFLTEVLVLKFLYHVPLERIRAMARSTGLKLSAGTLCGVLEKLTPLFDPLYEAIQAESRQAALCLMDETRWEVFVEHPNKGSHRWWLWVVVTHQTRLYIVAPSRSAAVPKAYFGYEPAEARCRYEPMVVVDRFKAYSFLKELLQLAYCWAHVRRDFLHLRLGGPEQEAWADGWIERIGQLYELNNQRLTLAKSPNGPEPLSAPFVELDPARMSSAAYAQADAAVRQALASMDQQCAQELAQNNLSRLRRKVLTSLQTHWQGLTLFADHPQIPMDNNGAPTGHPARDDRAQKLLWQRLKVERAPAGPDVNPAANPGAAPHQSSELSQGLPGCLRAQRGQSARTARWLAAVELHRPRADRRGGRAAKAARQGVPGARPMSAPKPDASVRFCGRDFSPTELQRIRFLIAQGNTWRSQLARQVCQEFGWLNAQGRLKEMSCKVALLRMQRAGLLVLPAPRGRNGNGKKSPPLQRLLALEPAPLSLPAHHLHALSLQLVCTPRERLLYRQMMSHHHYLGYYPMAGAQLRYLLYHDAQLLGGLGFGASAWSLADRDRFIGWSELQRQQNLHLVLNNHRFLLLPWVRSPNLASRVLGGVCRRLGADWLDHYGYRPVLLETFVQRPRFTGTAYRAANWVCVGVTKGRGKLEKRHQILLPQKAIFLYPLRPDFKEILTR
jgi:hypothetical protein